MLYDIAPYALHYLPFKIFPKDIYFNELYFQLTEIATWLDE